MSVDKNVIFSIEAEQSVLGGLLLDNDAFDRLGDLESKDFYRADHRTIFENISSMVLAGKAVDVVTLYAAMQASGDADLAYLNELAQNVPSAANITHYAGIVRDRSQRRGLAAVAHDIGDSAKDMGRPAPSIIESAQSSLEKLVFTRSSGEPIHISDALSDYVESLDRRYAGEGDNAISTGFPDLDNILNGGLRGGDLGLIAGRPKMGKTALALNIAKNVAQGDDSVAFLSMEMPTQQILDRSTAVIGRVDLKRLLNPRLLTNDDWPRITHAVQAMQELPLFIDDQGSLRLIDIRNKARALKRKHGLKVLFVDYLQLMEGDGDNRNAQIEQITRGLKGLAKELDIAILLLSQLNRQLENRPNKRPMPSDLRDSGAIEQDCDYAIFVYRDEVYNPDSPDRGVCEAIVGLNRQGSNGTVGLAYIGEQTRFESLGHDVVFGKKPERKPKFSGLKD